MAGFGFFGWVLLEIFKLRLLCGGKLRLSGLGLCVLRCFSGLELEPFCLLFVWDGRLRLSGFLCLLLVRCRLLFAFLVLQMFIVLRVM